jgi:hypothetical protein
MEGMPLLDVLRDLILDPQAQAALAANPHGYMQRFGYDDVNEADLAEAVSLVADTLPPHVAQAVTTAAATPDGAPDDGTVGMLERIATAGEDGFDDLADDGDDIDGDLVEGGSSRLDDPFGPGPSSFGEGGFDDAAGLADDADTLADDLVPGRGGPSDDTGDIGDGGSGGLDRLDDPDDPGLDDSGLDDTGLDDTGLDEPAGAEDRIGFGETGGGNGPTGDPAFGEGSPLDLAATPAPAGAEATAGGAPIDDLGSGSVDAREVDTEAFGSDAVVGGYGGDDAATGIDDLGDRDEGADAGDELAGEGDPADGGDEPPDDDVGSF